MCGIFFSISGSSTVYPNPVLQKRLQCRGPDSELLIACTFPPDTPETSASLHIVRYASILSLRGSHLAQPAAENADKNGVLCWNGEAWAVKGQLVDSNDPYECDSEIVLKLLQNAAQQDHDEEVESHVLCALASIEGPFAFVFYDEINSKVYYGRDYLGRRSLMARVNDHSLSLASVGDNQTGWSEINTGDICVLDLRRSVSAPRIENAIHTVSYESLGIQLSFNQEVPTPGSEIEFLESDSSALGELRCVFEDAVKKRVDKNLFLSSTFVHKTLTESRVAVLFSGGLDCSLISRVLHDHVDPLQSIDLLNVAFQNPRVHNRHVDLRDACESCPDRITGRQTFRELQSVCPERVWNFVTINVPYEETLAHRENVRSLIKPHDTEMDQSIACALYFAARGVGTLKTASGPTAYTTPARVLFSGLGADELFGGYQRHDTAFKQRGFEGLVEELKLDLDRLGKRNLGRDDRVISNWAKEVRYPFLDEQFVQWAVAAPVWHKCGFGRDSSHGKNSHLDPAKLALRILAWSLGMKNVAKEKKRAIQFGARTAKMEGGKTKGTDALK